MSRTGPGAPPKDWQKTLQAAVLQILTPEQQARWRDMTGEPFTSRVFLMGPGGFGMGPPRPKN
jgi:hypothetical protein